MKRLFLLLTIAVAAAFLISCVKKDAASTQHATVVLRDGTSVTGSVLAESASEIKILGDDKITRSIPRSQVQQVSYDQAQTAQANPPQQPAPDALPPQAQMPAPPPAEPVAPPPVSQPVPASPAAVPAPARRPAPAPPLPPEPVTTRTFVAPAGTQLQVRTDQAIDSATAQEGQTFPASVTASVKDSSGDTVIPRGARARIIIRSASKGGHFQGASDLVLDVLSVEIDGRPYQLSTTDLAQQGRQGIGANKRTGEFAGGGAALGAIIGAIAGGGKGAAIGAGSGAGAGALTQILTKGGSIKVPAESVLTFQLDRPLHVEAVN